MPKAPNPERKYRTVTAFQRRLNAVVRRLPGQTLLETTGRVSGLPRRTPVGGRREGDSFWLVSEFGERSQYIRNIRADPRVRVRIRAAGTRGRPTSFPTTTRSPACAASPASTAWRCGRWASGRGC